MQQLFDALAELAPSTASLLIEGETGVGKDVAAEAVHRASSRADQPLVAFDCAALSLQFAEWELLGAMSGDNVAESAIVQARGGTLLLDHVDELPPELQARLAATLVSMDVRVIALTTRNLGSDVERSAFHCDLFQRIASRRVVVPPLRERREDLPLLVEDLLLEQRVAFGVERLPNHLWQSFEQQRWRGNVRELKNTLCHWLLMTRGWAEARP
jgi:DNA-binding NtrC family response regulator